MPAKQSIIASEKKAALKILYRIQGEGEELASANSFSTSFFDFFYVFTLNIILKIFTFIYAIFIFKRKHLTSKTFFGSGLDENAFEMVEVLLVYWLKVSNEEYDKISLNQNHYRQRVPI